MMRKIVRKIMVVMLAVILVLQPVGMIDFGVINEVEAATDEKSGLTIVNEAIVIERIKTLAKLLEINYGNFDEGNGVQFTQYGKACGHPTSPGDAVAEGFASNVNSEQASDACTCTLCWNGNVINTKNNWFEKKFGFRITNVGLLSSHYTPTGKIKPSAYTCAGFVAFALWYIAMEDSTSSVWPELIGEQGMYFTKDNFDKYDVRIGDVVRTSEGHSFVYLGYTGNKLKVLDCNYVNRVNSKIATVRIHSEISFNSNVKCAVTRASNYEPDYNATLPNTLSSTSSSSAKTNIISYAKSLVGYTPSKFLAVGRNDIPSGDYCTWFLKLCGERVGIGNLFSSKTTVPEFCTDMIKNYGAQAFYYSDSAYITSTDKTALSGATAVTKSTFTPQVGDIYVFHENGCSGMNQVGFVTGMIDNSITIVAANNGTDVQTVVTRETSGFTYYQLNNSVCPIVAYIRPNYASLDRVALTNISLNTTNVSLNVGGTSTLSVAYNPSNTTDSKTVTWKSSNTSVATVSNGKITAVAPGTATITATCGGKTATCTVTVKQPLNSIGLNTTNVSLNVGATHTLTVTYNPSNTTDSKTVTWKSSNTSVATISNGKITAISPGIATITATCGGKTATCTVTVKQPLNKIVLSSTTLSMNVGGTQNLTVTYNPSNTTDSKTVTWKSSNTSVATVSNGKITAVAPGTATITATCGGKTASCTVTVEKLTSQIAISTKKLSMDVGTKNTLVVLDDEGVNVNNKDIMWKSSNNAIATVSSSGVVTAVSDGTVTIYATTADGKVTTSCVVTVKVVETETVTTPKSEMSSTTNKIEAETTTSFVETDSNMEPATSESETTTLGNTDENLSNEKNEYSTTLGENELLESEKITTNSDMDKSDVQMQHNYVLAMIITVCICIAGIIVFSIVKKVKK